MGQAQSGDTVKIHYTGKLDDGTQFDSSSGRDPLEFQLGDGQVIRGFEDAVQGMAVGDSKDVSLEPDDAYGQRHEHLVQEVPRSALPDDLSPEEGMALQATDPQGQVTQFAVIAVSADTITLDANHPLAGQTLHFNLELVAIG